MNRNANAAPLVDDAGAAPRSRTQTAKRLSPGTCVAGKYTICDVLGTGGSAVVYAAEQVGLKRVVAFKLYPASGSVAAQLLSRFEREAQLLARVHHENVVAVYDAGSMPDGSPYLVVQRLRGDSLAARLLAGPLAVTEAVALTRQTLNALSALSDAGITHRDVKPENLMLDRRPDGRTVLKLVDFGIAKQTHDEASRALDQMVGTPRYMAPEQVRGERIDARCDQYALAVTLYEMLTGDTPHTGETVHEIAMAKLHGPITPVRTLRRDCPEALEQIVMKALARDPRDRFASAHEMKNALDHWLLTQESQRELVETTHERAAVTTEDTPRARTLRASPSAARIEIRRARLLTVACLLAFGSLGIFQQLPSDAQRTEASGKVDAEMREARDGSPLDSVIEPGAMASTLVGQTSASAKELLKQARSAAQQLLEVMRRAAPGWSTGADVSERGR